MSEIKGQLLGIVLVLAIFGAIAGALVAAFSSVGDQVVEYMETATDTESEVYTVIERANLLTY